MGGNGPFTRSRSALLRAAVVAALVAVMAATSAGTAAARIVGPDVSGNNHTTGHAISWPTLQRAGVAFTFVKATEGSDFVNPNFASDFRAAGRLFRGAYHYARPSGRNNAEVSADAKAEAHHFIRVMGAMDGQGILPPVLDLEDAATLSPPQLRGWTRIWLREVRAHTGRTPIIYTFPDFWMLKMSNSAEFSGYPLWVAHYGVPSPRPFGGWKRYTFWQFTDRGRLSGSRLPLDINVFNGASSQLRAMTVKTPSAAQVSRALAVSRKPPSPNDSVAAGSSRTVAALAASYRSMSVATKQYINRVQANHEQSRPRMWPDVFDKGGIREIGQ